MEDHTQHGFGIHLYFPNYIKLFILIKVMSSKDSSISNNNIKWRESSVLSVCKLTLRNFLYEKQQTFSCS